jgi:hypothetical protein
MKPFRTWVYQQNMIRMIQSAIEHCNVYLFTPCIEFYTDCNGHDYCGFGLSASSGILNKHEGTQRFGNWSCFHPQVRSGRHLLSSVRMKELTND